MLYAPIGIYGEWARWEPPSASRMPAEPTQARPGSEEKIRVMEDRAARGEFIFHPDDRNALAARPGSEADDVD